MPWVGLWLSKKSFSSCVVADLLGVEDHEHRLVMAGAAGADLLIGRVRREPAGIADRRDMTPGSSQNFRSAPQKQPSPNRAFSAPCG